MKNKPLVPIFIVVFVDLLGFSLILPLLPYYAETFGASATLVGFLVASYAAPSLFAAGFCSPDRKSAGSLAEGWHWSSVEYANQKAEQEISDPGPGSLTGEL